VYSKAVPYSKNAIRQCGCIADKPETESQGEDKASVSLAGTVQKIIPPIMPGQPAKAEIAVHAGDELYREIRVP